MEQISIFDGNNKLLIDKPIRLVELFGGYGSQALALKYLGVPFEHHALSEWAVKSIQAYKDMHSPDDDSDYSETLSTDEIRGWLLGRISSDYSTPMTEKQIARLTDAAVRKIYNNMMATKNLGSIMAINGPDLNITDTDKYCYIMTYSFPCQDLSSAGKGMGMAKGSGTRSGLLWEVERLLKEMDELPQILLMENVPEVIGQKNKDSFSDWIAFLDSMGYKSKWEILNGTDFEIPQNRKRCFMVSVLGDYYYDFPQKLGCTLRLKDLLEKNVSEEYYLSDNILNYFVKHTKECEEKGNGFRFEPTDGDCIAKCVTTPTIDTGVGNWHTLIGEETYYGVGLNESESFRKPPMKERSRTLLANKADCGQGVLISQCECLGMLEGGKWDNSIESSRRVYSTEKAAPTVTTCGGGNQEIKILEPLLLGGIGDKKSNGGTQWYQQDRVYDSNGIAMAHCASIPNGSYNYGVQEPLALDEQNGYIRQDGTVGTIVTDGSSPKHNNRVVEPIPNMRVRKLTPRECFRLMGVKDKDYERVAENQSKSSLYHLAGDSIIVNVLMAIFREMTGIDWRSKVDDIAEDLSKERNIKNDTY